MHAGESEDDAGLEMGVEKSEIGLAADEEGRARGQRVDARGWGGLLGEEPGGDLAEAGGVVGAEVEFFGDPAGVDGIGREDEEDEFGIEARGDLGDDVRAWGDLGFVEPDGDFGMLAEVSGEVADKGFVAGGVAEEDAGHVRPPRYRFMVAKANGSWAVPATSHG